MSTLNLRGVPLPKSLKGNVSRTRNPVTQTLVPPSHGSSRISRAVPPPPPVPAVSAVPATPPIPSESGPRRRIVVPAGSDFARACDLFLDDWRFRSEPKIEEYLAWVAPADRLRLFQRLLRIELAKLKERGQSPMVEQYLCRFPQYTRAIREAWRGTFTQVLSPRDRNALNAPPPAIKAVYLDVIEGPHKGEAFEFAPGATVVIGRSRSLSVRLTDDRKISRRHVQLSIGTHDVRLIDLESRNGTLLNARRVHSADLGDSDVIFAGRSRIRVRIETVSALT